MIVFISFINKNGIPYTSLPNSIQKMAEKLMYEAIREGDTESVRRLLGHGDIVIDYDQSNNCLLIAAIRRGLIEVVRLLLEYQPITKNDCKALANAVVKASEGHLDILRVLLDYKKKMNMSLDYEGAYTPLAAAIDNNYWNIVQLLLATEEDINGRSYGRTPLMMAVVTNRWALTRLLLTQDNIDVNCYVQRHWGYTPMKYSALTYAAHAGELDIIKLLVSKGAKIRPRDPEIAFNRGYRKIGDLLTRWADDKQLLRSLTLQQRCWLTIRLHDIEYNDHVPPIMVYIYETLWVKRNILIQGYIERKRKKALS